MKITTFVEFQLDKKTIEAERNEQIDKTVLEIIQHVRNSGDQALFDYAEKFDSVLLDDLIVTDKEFKEAEQLVSAEFIEALDVAKMNIHTFHKAQIEKSWFINKADGVMLGQQVTPMDKVGVYIPGGKAAYPSTVLMNLIPAQLAGVHSIYIATPPQTDGKINPHVLVAAKSVGVEQVFKMCGAQAVAAFAYGTESIQKVDKIVGPGNDYVARAKKWVYGDVAIDMIAGPSEICIVADETAPAKYVAADLLSQAEHDEEARPICITTSESLAEEIKQAVNEQLEVLDRYEIAKVSIENQGVIIVV